jgi:hypothetical protein
MASKAIFMKYPTVAPTVAIIMVDTIASQVGKIAIIFGAK